MKHLILAASVALSMSSYGQALPPVPCDSIELRLHMAGDALELSADRSDLALYSLLIGGAMTAMAARGGEREGWVVGGITVLTSYTLFLNGNGHKRRAGRLLHRQY